MNYLYNLVSRAWESLFGCQHPASEARLELVPGEEFIRYYRKCPDCGAEWDEMWSSGG